MNDTGTSPQVVRIVTSNSKVIRQLEEERDRYREVLEQISTQEFYSISQDHLVKRIAREALEVGK